MSAIVRLADCPCVVGRSGWRLRHETLHDSEHAVIDGGIWTPNAELPHDVMAASSSTDSVAMHFG